MQRLRLVALDFLRVECSSSFFRYFLDGSQALLLIDFLVFHSVFLFSFLTAFIIEKFPSWQAAKVILLFGHETIFRLENVQNILWGNVLPASVFYNFVSLYFLGKRFLYIFTSHAWIVSYFKMATICQKR